jgi:hypothetical protein
VAWTAGLAPAGLVLSVALASTAGFAGLLSGWGGPAWLPALGLAPGLAVAIIAARAAPPAVRPCQNDLALGLMMVAAAGVWAAGLFGPGMLPVGDPIAVPQFAKSLAAGSPLTEAFPPGTSGHAYPPGYPLLFAPVEAWLRPDRALMAFKAVTVAVVALIPLAWAWLHRALFGVQGPAWPVILAAYGVFILVERHLGFLTPFAGKNAVEFALLLFPGVALAAVRLSEAPRIWPLAAAPLFGLFLIHYSMLHLAVAFLAAYAVAGRRWRWPMVLKLAAAGAIATALLLLAASEALRDPRAAAAPWTPLQGLSALARTLVAARPEVVIFHDADFGLAPAHYRLAVLAACAALAIVIGLSRRWPATWRPAAVYALAIAASLAFGYGLLPAHITVDFVRCYLWPLQAMLFMTAGLALVAVWRGLPTTGRWGFAAVAAPAVLMAMVVGARDMQVERDTFKARSQPRGAVRQIVRALPQDRPCFLIAHSQARPDVLITVQDPPAWNYAEALSPCMFVGGSWVHSGWPGGRDLGGLPSARALRRLPADLPVFFVGSAEQARAYADALAGQGQGLGWRWRRARADVAGVDLWKADPANPEEAEAMGERKPLTTGG